MNLSSSYSFYSLFPTFNQVHDYILSIDTSDCLLLKLLFENLLNKQLNDHSPDIILTHMLQIARVTLKQLRIQLFLLCFLTFHYLYALFESKVVSLFATLFDEVVNLESFFTSVHNHGTQILSAVVTHPLALTRIKLLTHKFHLKHSPAYIRLFTIV
jgi:hypothetical protein